MNLLVRNVIEREIEREKVQMKPPIGTLINLINLSSYYNKIMLNAALQKLKLEHLGSNTFSGQLKLKLPIGAINLVP